MKKLREDSDSLLGTAAHRWGIGSVPEGRIRIARQFIAGGRSRQN
ncbi:Uncharacterized protein dnm_033310 [Desulfonema magnum]|nr:Uncharacterized protein dnm_033310 [Desulfonema magnum]